MHAVDPAGSGPVVIAYDGSDLAKLAIDEAGDLLSPGREALVLCVWQPFDLGFVPADDAPLDAKSAVEVRAAAGRTAAAGSGLAKAAGFHARPLEVESSPVWKGIVEAGEQHHASLIVLGSHGRNGLTGVVVGSVARAVADHSKRTVLIAHRRS
ncbi:MAG TPA: universal stress protein [Solirubrobacteraceae bacterium]|jgi:nucleotide-binding universal stress UspA family protein